MERNVASRQALVHESGAKIPYVIASPRGRPLDTNELARLRVRCGVKSIAYQPGDQAGERLCYTKLVAQLHLPPKRLNVATISFALDKASQENGIRIRDFTPCRAEEEVASKFRTDRSSHFLPSVSVTTPVGGIQAAGIGRITNYIEDEERTFRLQPSLISPYGVQFSFIGNKKHYYPLDIDFLICFKCQTKETSFKIGLSAELGPYKVFGIKGLIWNKKSLTIHWDKEYEPKGVLAVVEALEKNNNSEKEILGLYAALPKRHSPDSASPSVASPRSVP